MTYKKGKLEPLFFFKKIKAHFKFYAFCVILMNLSGCESGQALTCEELPKIQGEVKSRRLLWAAYLLPNTKTGRSPASATAPVSSFPYEDSKNWAGSLIKKSTLAKDSLEDEDNPPREIMVEMSDATMTLVHVHGYLSKESIQKAYDSLGDFEEKLTQISEKLCKK